MAGNKRWMTHEYNASLKKPHQWDFNEIFLLTGTKLGRNYSIKSISQLTVDQTVKRTMVPILL